MKVEFTTPLSAIRILDGAFVSLRDDLGAELDYGFIRADIASENGFEIARNGLRHCVHFSDFDNIKVLSEFIPKPLDTPNESE